VTGFVVAGREDCSYQTRMIASVITEITRITSTAHLMLDQYTNHKDNNNNNDGKPSAR
jgi:hypothetical protein